MSPEEFEKQLKQRPVRQMPAEWRAEILSAAKAAGSESRVQAGGKSVSIWTMLKGWVVAGLELKPKALAGLAALWVAILALHFSTHDDSNVAISRTPVSKQVITEVREQRQYFAELAGLRQTPDAEPPRPSLPKPRSESRPQLIVV